ncbi:MAG: endopeptidase La [Oscillospiraceae bacterium]|nr:endopeptidase La [Oscillospiraceae bacterium]
MKKVDTNQYIAPVVCVKGDVFFPRMTMSFEVTDESSVNAVIKAIETDKKIFIVFQVKNLSRITAFSKSWGKDDLCDFGVIAKIEQAFINGDDSRVTVTISQKAALLDLARDKNHKRALFSKIPYRAPKISDSEMTAIVRALTDAFSSFIANLPIPKPQAAIIVETIRQEKSPLSILHYIVSKFILNLEQKVNIARLNDIYEQIMLCIDYLYEESQIIRIEKDIMEKTRSKIESHNREVFLREQLKNIREELGEGADSENYMETEDTEYFDRIEKIKNIDDASRKHLIQESERLIGMPPHGHENHIIRNYLNIALELPWDKQSKDNINIPKAQKMLDKDHYGMDKVKKRILETLSVYILSKSIKGQIICLVGPPGVGKTSIARAIAEAIGRKYQRISLGGLSDESEIRGHRKTYVGAMPGRIINALKKAGTNNPLMLFDEIDKMGKSYQGDPYASLLEVLDSEQNMNFVDRFMEIPFDLSNILFVLTANSTADIPIPLLDRMEVIELSSYTAQEKFFICKKHLFKKQLKKHGLKASQLKISDSAVYTLIENYTKEAGVRRLERRIAELCRKAALEIASNNAVKVNITNKNLEQFVGAKKYVKDKMIATDQVGVVNGLAYTSVGGEMLTVEVNVLQGTGKLELTGRLGDVMKESAKTAVSFVRNIAPSYGISPTFYKDNDIHFHVPDGATPKDGPSAGIALATALVSALSGLNVNHKVAMTGEVTLRGRVLPIGGLKEKTMAAYRAGIQTVLVPDDNAADLMEIDKTVAETVEFVKVAGMDDVLNHALIKQEENKLCEPSALRRRIKETDKKVPAGFVIG